MAKQLHLLDTAAEIPNSAYLILNKLSAGTPLDYKIDVGTLLAPYINRNTEVGNEIGKIPVLIDIGGSPALPAVDGSQLTNIAYTTGTGAIEGGVRLSDSTTSTSGVTEGFAATPKAVRDASLGKLATTGGSLTGNLTFNNNTGVLSKNTSGDVITLLKVTTGNVLNIGAFGAVPLEIVNLAAGTVLNITDEDAVTKFSFNTSTGASTGIKATDVSAASTSSTVAGTVQTALAELSAEKFDKSGGTLTGNLTFNNNIKAYFGAYAQYYNSASSTFKLFDTGVAPTYVDLTVGTEFRIRNSSGTSRFSFNTSTGTSSGLKASDISSTATGSISSTNVQAAIAELATEKLSSGATASNASNLGGIAAASYLLASTAASTYLTVNGTAYSSNRLGGTLAADFRTKAQNDALYLGLLSTASNSSQLGGISAANYLTSATAASTYLGKTAIAADSSKLGGLVASNYLTESYADTKYVTISGATVNNALNLGGVAAADYLTESEATANYLGKTATATNANNLGGAPASTYITNVQTAYNSNRLGGTSSSSFSTTSQSDARYLRKNASNTVTYPTTLTDFTPLNIGTGLDAVLTHDATNTVLSLFNGNFIIDNGSTKSFTFDRVSGDVTNTGNILSTSDIRVKENFQVIPDALDKVDTLTGWTFDRTDIDTKRQTGLIAQDVLNILPEAVSSDKDGKLAVSYGNLVGLLVEAIKELRVEVNTLKEVIDDTTH